ncbi:hydroxypyruvate isomerase family protein [Halalkalibacter nanhaiisediminis]|uniref:Hydroxypyruvate isomerase n=1 Tax=Halalkalibacter nanhaiisediminis TaxID=688079 RepID=A0A562QES4_9BACI|nr:TIM barrel protein [Halalkalibacter nanhaiisediminis]TWI55257.1 hydroxypyruvate isomerase [Halalkalibacter nanhaiisediminis]
MNQFSVNLSTIFTEYPFIDRIKKAKEHGFTHVECQFPYPYSLEKIKRELDDHHLSMVLINLPPGDWVSGDRGMAIDPNRIEEFRESVKIGIRYATTIQCPRIHCMAGVMPEKSNKEQVRDVFINNIKYAAAKMAEHDLTLLIEPINTFDIPGYFLNDLHEAVHIIKEVHSPNVKLQFDFYHIQRTYGHTLTLFERYTHLIEHVQIADVPGRYQPGTGEMDYQEIFDLLHNLHYEGFIGLEYSPKGKSEESFNWMTTR